MATTTNFGWTKPTVDADVDTWGTILNDLFDDIDSVVAPTASPRFTGTLTLGPVAATGSPKVQINSNSGTLAPPYTGDIHILGDDSGGGARVAVDGFNNGPQFLGRLAIGTRSSPTAGGVSSGSWLVGVFGRAYLSTGYSASQLGGMAVMGAETFSDSTAKTAVGIYTTASGSVAQALRFYFTTQSGGGAQLGIGTSSPATSAALDITSTTGALLVPRMTTTQRDAMTATDGMIIYNTTAAEFQSRKAGAWVSGV